MTGDGAVKQHDFKQANDYVIALNDYFRSNLIRRYMHDPSRLGYEFGFASNQTLIAADSRTASVLMVILCHSTITTVVSIPAFELIYKITL
jgi:hypothetical protein